MIKYFCDYCEQEVNKDSRTPCEDCINKLKRGFTWARENSEIDFGTRLKVGLNNLVLGECSDEAMDYWFKDLLPRLKAFGKMIEPVTEQETPPTDVPSISS